MGRSGTPRLIVSFTLPTISTTLNLQPTTTAKNCLGFPPIPTAGFLSVGFPSSPPSLAAAVVLVLGPPTCALSLRGAPKAQPLLLLPVALSAVAPRPLCPGPRQVTRKAPSLRRLGPMMPRASGLALCLRPPLVLLRLLCWARSFRVRACTWCL